MIYRVEILCGKRSHATELKIGPGELNFVCCSLGPPECRPIGERCNPEVAAAEARKNARDAGWIFIVGAWLCPSCKPKPDPVP